MRRKTTFPSRRLFACAWALALAAPVAAHAQEPAPPATHTVRAGDTLWELARQYLGDPFLWPRIHRLNAGVIADPRRLYPGQVIRLPAEPGVSVAPDQDPPAPADVAEPGQVAPAPAPQARPDDPWAPYPVPEFARRQIGTQATALRSYVSQEYQPLRRGEFHAAGFLTEGRLLPYGRVLGPVTPPQIRNLTERQTAAPGSAIGVRSPAGAEYAVGDTLLLLLRETGFRGYGDMVVPTGLARVTGQSGGQYTAEVVALYGPVRQGQAVLPVEPYVPGPMSRPVPAADSVRGAVLGAKSLRELKTPQSHLFINLGREHGVAPGDIVEIRREPGPRGPGAESVDELMARGQVVHAGERSATVLLTQVMLPDIAPGTPAIRVATLPR